MAAGGDTWDRTNWEIYWGKNNHRGSLYSIIAEFYRKIIIRPSLNHFIRKYIPTKSTLLHAGCGSGQVDTDLSQEYIITGLDISETALAVYRKTNRDSDTVCASIFSTGLPEKSYDGIYNLGVLEHFTRDRIQVCLTEFHRILKDNGKLVIFWPPEFGTSVVFFKILLKGLELFFRWKPKFFPDEVSRVTSQADVTSQFEGAGFRIIRYSFSTRDVWT